MIKIKPAGKNELTNSLPAFTLWSGGLAPPKMEGKPPLLSDFPYFALYPVMPGHKILHSFPPLLAYLKTIFTSHSFTRAITLHPVSAAVAMPLSATLQ